MGAVNYKTSDYITLGVKLLSACDIEQDNELMQELTEQAAECGQNPENTVYYYIADCYDEDRGNVEFELDKHCFKWFRVAIEPGYYEGFTLDITDDFPAEIDADERREARAEIDELERCLIECAGLGLVKCSPGWCTGYADYAGTLDAIGKAVQAMIEDLAAVPAWEQEDREGA